MATLRISRSSYPYEFMLDLQSSESRKGPQMGQQERRDWRVNFFSKNQFSEAVKHVIV